MGTMELVLGIVSLAAFIWVTYQVWGVNKSLSTGVKVIWTIAALFFSIITVIVYYFMEGRKTMNA